MQVQSQSPETSVPSAQQIEAVTQEVLGRAEFERDMISEWQVFLTERLWGAVTALADWAEAHPNLRWLLVAILVILLVFLVGHIIYTILKAVPARKERSRINLSDHSVWKALEGKARDGREAMRMAREALSRGDLYGAVWIGHRLLLGLLDHKGLLEVKKWKTNSDYLKECRKDHSDFGLLQSLSRTYDAVVYAHRPDPAADLEELLNRVDEVQESLIAVSN